VIWLAKYAPHRNPKEREWRYRKRDARSHLAASLRDFVDGILGGLRHLGAILVTIVDEVPQWFLEGHRKPPTGRPPGRPVGAKDSYKRAPYRRKANLPAHTWTMVGQVRKECRTYWTSSPMVGVGRTGLIPRSFPRPDQPPLERR